MKLRSTYIKGTIEVGCDEAGRGCLAGPVVAAAVILPYRGVPKQLTDSKKLPEKKRLELKCWIEEKAIAWAIGVCSPAEIDEINILNASFRAMHRALDQIQQPYDHLLIDGNRFTPYRDKKHYCLIKGDARFRSIAAASILAKTYRDAYMQNLALEYPSYQWGKNKGYPTRDHRQALITYGKTHYHRNSFQLIPSQLELNLNV
jgi:ribonuclease HII